MIGKVYNLWKHNRWLLVIIGSIVILCVLSIFNKIQNNHGSSDFNSFNFSSFFGRPDDSVSEAFSNDRFTPPMISDQLFDSGYYIPTSLKPRNEIHEINERVIKTSNQSEREFVPETTASKGENECRKSLETIFQKNFIKARIPELLNPITGSFLELDMYCESLGVACEYQGEQHYRYIKHFHKNKDAFRMQQYRDWVKEKLCKENNIKLILVPYTVKIQDIHNFILAEVRKMKFH